MNIHKESIANLTKVSMTIAKHLFSKQKYQEKNVVISPLSLHIVLSIIAAGSEGPTQQQLMSFLRSETNSNLYPLNSFPMCSPMLLPLADLSCLSPMESGLNNHFLFNLPSKKL
jgi:serine protease inhibitor